MMTRTNFNAIALDIREIKHKVSTIEEMNLIRTLANNLAKYFKQDNPSFDKGKFMRACGWYDE